jgi:hypothetical protein
VLSVRADEQVGEPTVRLLQQYGRTVSDERFGRVSSGEVLLQIG